ncbi:hypothetical protein AVEN_243529-1 [Araneus ventricosus]|uniref:Uncharacterized protein n=1 Tax=Araneus ventricosus TaxID=182803 RepID=A0A4Y2NUF6_ARAVE|nr:hypothetical protein AVEN_243529-1 [Araneus ventricosus]
MRQERKAIYKSIREKIGGHGGLVARSRLRGQKVPGPQPGCTENPLYMWAWPTLNPTLNLLSTKNMKSTMVLWSVPLIFMQYLKLKKVVTESLESARWQGQCRAKWVLAENRPKVVENG